MYNPQLETFLVVADVGSFNKAASQLFISPPAVIKQINQLEATLEVTLFERTHRGLRLTEAGKNWPGPVWRRWRNFIKKIGLPTTLRELGVDETVDLKAIADSCNLAPGSYKKMTHEEILQIFHECC